VRFAFIEAEKAAVPCGEEAADVLVWWGYDTVDVEASPPSVEIEVPSTVECPSTVDLDISANDNEEDYAEKRWLVDGVLLADDIEQVEFTASHELTVILRDARGATASDTEVISCE
jgi:hypothetical protein